MNQRLSFPTLHEWGRACAVVPSYKTFTQIFLAPALEAKKQQQVFIFELLSLYLILKIFSFPLMIRRILKKEAHISMT